MELIFDNKTGTWGEAPEVYGTIECATKEDYEYAKKAIKGYKELEAKHWDECRQIAHYDNELKKAKRLLKLALQDMNSNNICYDINACNVCTENKRISCNTFRWRYTDEALKLLGGSENG